MKETVAVIFTRTEPKQYLAGGTIKEPLFTDDVQKAIGFKHPKSAVSIQRHLLDLSCTILDREVGNKHVEILCHGEVHYRRPNDDGMVLEAMRTEGYSVRLAEIQP